MPVYIESIDFFSELQGVSDDPVDWTLANVGDKLRIELAFSVKTFAVASSDNPMVLNKTDGYIGNGWIKCSDQGFKDFKIGDKVIIYNYVAVLPVGSGNPSYYTIVDKIDDYTIQINVDILGLSQATDVLTEQAVVSVIVPITGAVYKWNFVENNDAPTFDSKISGTMHQLINKLIDANSTTPLNMDFLGEMSYQIGSATIEGVDIDDGTTDGVYKSRFKIIHETYITPFMLSDQWADILLNTAPSYFVNAKCLKGIFDIEAMYDYTDPNRIQTLQITETLGNTGWFNENFNTGVTNYSVGGVVYTNAASVVISKLELTTATTAVAITINNTVDSPFSNNNTKFVLNFCKAPNDDTEYKLNGRNVTDNFVFDRALQTVGASAVNGDSYSGLSVLKNVRATYINATQIVINFDAIIDADSLAVLNESADPRYMIWVSIQDHTLTMKTADKVSLLVDANDFYEDTTEPGMILCDSLILRHPESDPDTQGITPGLVPGTDAAAIQFTDAHAGTGGILYVITNYGPSGKIIGNALWDTDFDTTMANLVNSMNTNTDDDPLDTSLMKANTGFSTFDNAAGYTSTFQSLFPSQDADDLNWTITHTGGGTGVQMIDNVSGKTIGNAAWNVDLLTTMDDLANSINTNTQSGAMLNAGIPFGPAHGYTANWVQGADYLELFIPPDKGATYNGRNMFLAVGGGVWTVTPNQTQPWANGVNERSEFIVTPPAGCLDTINGEGLYYYSWQSTTPLATIEGNIQYWQYGTPDGFVYLDVEPEDELVAYNKFHIDATGKTLSDIVITSVEAKVKVKNVSTLDEFQLDGFELKTANYAVIADVQYWNFQLDRPFHLPALAIRKLIQTRRRSDLDSGDDYYFEMWYPFIMRWEEWIKLMIANSDFFDTSEQQNGYNHFWHHYQSGDWELYYELIVKATYQGAPQTYNFEMPIRSNDYNSNAAWDTKTIKTYDPDTVAPLLSSGNYYVLGYKDTLVKATFNKVAGAPVLADCVVVFRIEVFEEGGVTGSRRFSSKWEADADTWFKSTDTSNKVVLSLAMNTITAECLIDYTKIPAKAKFKITARIYELTLAAPGFATELGVAMVVDPGNFRIFE